MAGQDGSRVRFGTKAIIIATPFNYAHGTAADEDAADEHDDDDDDDAEAYADAAE